MFFFFFFFNVPTSFLNESVTTKSPPGLPQCYYLMPHYYSVGGRCKQHRAHIQHHSSGQGVATVTSGLIVAPPLLYRPAPQ